MNKDQAAALHAALIAHPYAASFPLIDCPYAGQPWTYLENRLTARQIADRINDRSQHVDMARRIVGDGYVAFLGTEPISAVACFDVYRTSGDTQKTA